ncbi:uncharacterized protein [Haliotis cracherodii]|uniref:uncharacterized protein n=1 Tax=Haliotis cracherodii TaxID=6455 RepID=UPI0039EC8FA6
MVFGGGITAAASDDDWFVEGSDEEGGADEQKDPPVNWTPDAKDILAMFEKLDKDKMLELRWKCPGRRAPSPEKGSADYDVGDEEDMYSDDDSKEEEIKAPEISEFDFDDFGSEASAKPTPRRTPGSKTTPRSQKKVASMDNVLNKIRHQQIEKAAIKEARRGMSRSPASPARFRLGMSGSPGPASSRRPVSSTGTPLRPTYDPSDDPFAPSTSLFRDSKVPPAPTTSEVQGVPEVKLELPDAAEPPTSETKPND